jgi:hypothetical protein
MTEFCYTSLCGHGEVEASQQYSGTRDFCAVFQDMVREVGAASMLETSPCPLLALTELTPRSTDSPSQSARRKEIANKLIGTSGLFGAGE